MDSDLLSPRVIPFRRPVPARAPTADWRATLPVVRTPPAVSLRAARPAPPEHYSAMERGPGGALGDVLTLAFLAAAGVANTWLLLAAFGVRL